MTNQLEVAARLAQLRREKSARERRDVTQAIIAADNGIVPETYSRYENGRRKVPEEVVVALAKYYGVTPAFIRYGVETSAPRKLSDEEIAAARARVAARGAKPAEPRSRAAAARCATTR